MYTDNYETEAELKSDLIANFGKFVDQIYHIESLLQNTNFIEEYAIGKRSSERAYGFNLRGMTRDGVLIGTEYNDSCSCHPEWQTEEILIPWSDVKNMIEDFDRSLADIKAENKAAAERAAEARRQQQEREAEARRRAQEERDRAEFERLRRQFGDKA